MPRALPIGTQRTNCGYVLVKTAAGWRYEHRVVADAKLGEIVHHKNHNRSDNPLHNLEKMTRAAHTKLHNAERRRLTTWSKDHDRCQECGTADSPHAAKGLCSPCWQRANAVHKGCWPAARTMTENCSECGLSGRKHRANGICHACYERLRRLKKRGRPYGTWSRNFDACIKCTGTDKPHRSKGECTACYRRIAAS